jgi:hypothetical protein
MSPRELGCNFLLQTSKVGSICKPAQIAVTGNAVDLHISHAHTQHEMQMRCPCIPFFAVAYWAVVAVAHAIWLSQLPTHSHTVFLRKALVPVAVREG